VKGLIYDGAISEEELKVCKGIPSQSRLQKGPVAVIECIQEIPCNPCEEACRLGAIKIGSPITNVPILDEDKCIGCGQCLAKCPGLAIFLEDHTFSENEALVSFPYEFLPLPKIGDKVMATDREGNEVCTAVVHKITVNKSYDSTNVVTLKIDKNKARDVRGMKIIGGEENAK